MRGEHDIAGSEHLAATLARAAELDDADVVVDLSGVTFMDASTIGTIVDAHNRLRARARSLTIRAPSPRCRRLLDVCGLEFLIDGRTDPPPVGTALDSWVAVPTSDRASDPEPPGATRRTPSPETHATRPRPGAPAATVPQRRPPS